MSVNLQAEKPITLDELPIMKFLPPELKTLMMDCFVPADFNFGGDILNEGEVADAFYVLAEGRVRMVQRSASGEEVPLNVLQPGECFGATGLLDPKKISKRATTVRASSDVKAYKLEPQLFQSLVAKHPEIKSYLELEQRHHQLASFLKLHTIFSNLPADAVKLLTIEAETITVEAEDFLVHQGDAAGPMFIVEEGKLRVSATQGQQHKELAFLRKGDVFGEVSIAKGKRRDATVQALTQCRLLKINERAFGKLYARFPEFRIKIE